MGDGLWVMGYRLSVMVMVVMVMMMMMMMMVMMVMMTMTMTMTMTMMMMMMMTVHILRRARHGVDQHVSASNPPIPLDATELDEEEDPTISVYL